MMFVLRSSECALLSWAPGHIHPLNLQIPTLVNCSSGVDESKAQQYQRKGRVLSSDTWTILN
jgi:hypothetical protein